MGGRRVQEGRYNIFEDRFACPPHEPAMRVIEEQLRRLLTEEVGLRPIFSLGGEAVPTLVHRHDETYLALLKGTKPYHMIVLILRRDDFISSFD